MPYRPELPTLIGLPLRLMPGMLQRQLGSLLLQRLLRDRLAEGELDFLEGRYAGFEITDCGLRWTCTLDRGHLRLVDDIQPEAMMRCRLIDVVRMANRHADPDTLFFRRRLSMQGDTELGLAMKNLMDAFDSNELPDTLRRLLRRLEALLDDGRQPAVSEA